MPFAGEVGLIPALLQHRSKRPLRRRQATPLSLESHRGHAAAVWDSAGLHGGAARRAARLGVKREEGHSFSSQLVDARCWHAAAFAATVGAEIAIAGVVRDDEQD